MAKRAPTVEERTRPDQSIASVPHVAVYLKAGGKRQQVPAHEFDPELHTPARGTTTIKVKNLGETTKAKADERVINRSDFNPELHEEVVAGGAGK